MKRHEKQHAHGFWTQNNWCTRNTTGYFLVLQTLEKVSQRARILYYKATGLVEYTGTYIYSRNNIFDKGQLQDTENSMHTDFVLQNNRCTRKQPFISYYCKHWKEYPAESSIHLLNNKNLDTTMHTSNREEHIDTNSYVAFIKCVRRTNRY